MTRSAAQLCRDRRAAVAVAQLDPIAAIVEPAVALLHQPHQGGEQIRPYRREPVLLARALSGLAVVLALEQPLSTSSRKRAAVAGSLIPTRFAKSSCT